jgi:hypothetical protein
LLALGHSRCLRFDGSAYAFSVQFTTLEKIEHLVCGKRLFANGEDYFPIGSLHWESHRQSLLPEQADGLHNIVSSLEIIHDKLTGPTSLLKSRSQV